MYVMSDELTVMVGVPVECAAAELLHLLQQTEENTADFSKALSLHCSADDLDRHHGGNTTLLRALKETARQCSSSETPWLLILAVGLQDREYPTDASHGRKQVEFCDMAHLLEATVAIRTRDNIEIRNRSQCCFCSGIEEFSRSCLWLRGSESYIADEESLGGQQTLSGNNNGSCVAPSSSHGAPRSRGVECVSLKRSCAFFYWPCPARRKCAHDYHAICGALVAKKERGTCRSFTPATARVRN